VLKQLGNLSPLVDNYVEVEGIAKLVTENLDFSTELEQRDGYPKA